MTKTIVNITMSLDGFIAGKNISRANLMGENGILLHQWIFDESTDTDKEILSSFVESAGAVILGSTTYNTAISDAWGGHTPFKVPAFVLTSKEPSIVKDGFTFTGESIRNAHAKALAIAKGKNTWIMGGANVIQQFLEENLVDEIQVHIAPILLGSGTLLFDSARMKNTPLKKLNAIETKGATHLFYELIK